LLGLRENVLPRHVANQFGMQNAHMILHVPPQLVLVSALNDIPAHADDPRRHHQPPDWSTAILAGQSPTARGRRATALLDRNAGSSYPAIPARQGMCSTGAQIRMNWMPRSKHQDSYP
jgi:hypothetical protein